MAKFVAGWLCCMSVLIIGAAAPEGAFDVFQDHVSESRCTRTLKPLWEAEKRRILTSDKSDNAKLMALKIVENIYETKWQLCKEAAMVLEYDPK